MVKNPPGNGGDAGSIPGQRTKGDKCQAKSGKLMFMANYTIVDWGPHGMWVSNCSDDIGSIICDYATQVASGQFSCSVVSNSLRPHESQHATPPCLSLTPGVHSNSCPSSR